jgi:HSP20 family molecular chaperone IbpA
VREKAHVESSGTAKELMGHHRAMGGARALDSMAVAESSDFVTTSELQLWSMNMANIAVEKVKEGGPESPSLVQKLEAMAERIRRRAYEIFESRGADGSAIDDWLQAERDLTFAPQSELIEKDSKFEIRIAAPGFQATETSVTALPEAVIVSAESAHEHAAMRAINRQVRFGAIPPSAICGGILATFTAFGSSLAIASTPTRSAPSDGTALAQDYAKEVDRRLNVPDGEQRAWASLLAGMLADRDLASQYIVLVDRNRFIQAIAIYWMAPDRSFHFIGASPASTGKPGSFDHFITPTGVFEHTIGNPDFRAEGTRNENGVRGYGRKGMRVYDFGWQRAERGWGRGGEATIRLQMHATDPDLLELRLGTIQSKGCIRIPATLNAFIDRHAILDAEYEEAMADGQTFWVLSKERDPTPWPGRFLVIVDTGGTSRPQWSPLLRK